MRFVVRIDRWLASSESARRASRRKPRQSRRSRRISLLPRRWARWIAPRRDGWKHDVRVTTTRTARPSSTAARQISTHRDENMLNEATRHDNKTPSKVPVSSPNLFKAGMGGARDRARCKSETVSSYSRSSPARGSLRLGCRPNAQRGADSIVCAAWR